jgi:hypothetical protein
MRGAIFMQKLVVALLLIWMGAVAHAQTTPPDVRHGERYDGRPAGRSVGHDLLWVPRLVLAPPRFVLRGFGAVMRPGMEWTEQHHVFERVNAMITSADGLVGVRPAIDFELHFKPAFGISYFNHRLPGGARLSVSTAVGGTDVVIANARARVPLAEGALSFDFNYKRRSEELFTGIGMGRMPFARYGIDAADLRATFSAAPVRHVSVELGGALGVRRFNDGIAYDAERPIDEVYCEHAVGGRCWSQRVDERLVPGFSRGSQFVRETFAIHLDSRRGPTIKGSGVRADGALQYTQGLGHDHSHYLRVSGSLAGEIDLWRRRSIFVRLHVDDELQIGAGPIPFSELVQLGGPNDLRGFRRGIFRDHSAVLGTVEYHWPIWMWMDGVVFADYGGVFGPELRGFSFEQMRPDVGLGVRVHTPTRYTMRVQLAYGFGDRGGIQLVVAGNGNPI